MAAVNAFISGHAAALISPQMSTWTTFLTHLAQLHGHVPRAHNAANLQAGGVAKDSNVCALGNCVPRVVHGLARVTKRVGIEGKDAGGEGRRSSGEGGGEPLILHLCCKCGRRDGGRNLMIAVGAAVPRPPELLAAAQSTQCPLTLGYGLLLRNLTTL